MRSIRAHAIPLLSLLPLTNPAAASEFTLREAQQIPINTPFSQPEISAPADFDSDGVKDFVAGTSLYLGRGDGTFDGVQVFEEPVRPLSSGDVDGDGAPDLLVISPWYTAPVIGPGEVQELRVLRNERDRSGQVVFHPIQAWPVTWNTWPLPLQTPILQDLGRLADVDGDGALDVVVFAVVVEEVWNPEFGGIENTGRSYYMVSRGDGAGNFAEWTQHAADYRPPPLSGYTLITFGLQDLNGDGHPDIVGVLASEHEQVAILLNDGSGGFGAAGAYSLYPEAGPPLFANTTWPADVDGDGDTDLLVSYISSQQPGFISLLRNRGDGTFDPEAYELMPGGGSRPPVILLIAGGDYDGDGRLDAVAVTTSPQWVLSISDFLDPERKVVRPAVLREPNEEESSQMQVDDLNGDGLVDLIVNGSYCDRSMLPCTAVVFLGTLGDGFVRGDASVDGRVDLSDPIAILGYLFLGEESEDLSRCLDLADADDSGEVDLADAVYLLNHLFRGGPPVPPPYPEAGIDPTEDANVCER